MNTVLFPSMLAAARPLYFRDPFDFWRAGESGYGDRFGHITPPLYSCEIHF